jgi:hypothetical protein
VTVKRHTFRGASYAMNGEENSKERMPSEPAALAVGRGSGERDRDRRERSLSRA